MSRYKKYRTELIDELGGNCENCGTEENLHFHHINPEDSHKSGLGGWNHIFKVKNDIKNGVEVVLLCESCHRIIHENEDNFENKI